MMHKAWSNIEEVSYCFSRSSINFQGHTGQKIANFYPNWVFPDCNFSLNSPDGFEMMHKAWCSIEEVPYCFPRSYIKFQGHKGWKIDDLDQIWARLLGRSQLSNPSDLPCWQLFDEFSCYVERPCWVSALNLGLKFLCMDTWENFGTGKGKYGEWGVQKRKGKSINFTEFLQICAVFLFSFFQRVGQYFSVTPSL